MKRVALTLLAFIVTVAFASMGCRKKTGPAEPGNEIAAPDPEGASTVPVALPEDFIYITNNGTITITDVKDSAAKIIALPDEIDGMPVTKITAPLSASVTTVYLPKEPGDIAENGFSLGITLVIPYTSTYGATPYDTWNAVSRFSSEYTIAGNALSYSGTTLEDLIIPYSINGIRITMTASDAFRNLATLRTVFAPYITTIGENAFRMCAALTNISVSNVRSIGANALSGCAALQNACMSNAETIGAYAFYQCVALTNAFLPNATSIGANAFYYCISLTHASFPSARGIGDYAFYYCTALTNASMPNAETIGAWAFRGTALSSASFPNARTIGNYAFYQCNALTNANFPEATSIGREMFSNCVTLLSIAFPKATTIGEGAFYHCIRLTNASFPQAHTIKFAAFYQCQSIPDASFPRATTIAFAAFGGCSSLTNATFGPITTIGSYAFHNDYNLKTLSVYCPKWPYVEAHAFEGTPPEKTIYVPTGTGMANQWWWTEGFSQVLAVL